MAALKLMMVMLLVAYASAADFDTVYGRFNDTIKGKCTATTTAATTTAATTTAATTTAAAAGPTTAAPAGTGAAGPTTTVAPAVTDSTTPARKKRAADIPPCQDEEKKVLATDNLEDFKTNLNLFSKCQKANCLALTPDVDQLIKDSGATAVKVCGLLLVLLIAMSYFG